MFLLLLSASRPSCTARFTIYTSSVLALLPLHLQQHDWDTYKSIRRKVSTFALLVGKYRTAAPHDQYFLWTTYWWAQHVNRHPDEHRTIWRSVTAAWSTGKEHSANSRSTAKEYQTDATKQIFEVRTVGSILSRGKPERAAEQWTVYAIRFISFDFGCFLVLRKTCYQAQAGAARKETKR